MRTVRVQPPSFPDAELQAPLPVAATTRWQVLCGDSDHWRAGVYSPAETAADQIAELECHDCPELFLLLTGRLTLVVFDGGRAREIELEPQHPVVVTAPHCGYCPDGSHTGSALVVERDVFSTEYGTVEEWAQR